MYLRNAVSLICGNTCMKDVLIYKNTSNLYTGKEHDKLLKMSIVNYI